MIPKSFGCIEHSKKDPVSKLKFEDAIVTDGNRMAKAFTEHFSSVFLSSTSRVTFVQQTCLDIPNLVIDEKGICLALLELQ